MSDLIKPPDCTCEWPEVRVRNMCGHPETCGYYARWERECWPHNPPERLPAQGGSPKFAKPTPEQLANRYSYHPPHGDQARRYETIRSHCLGLANLIVSLTPCSPEQARALNALDEVMMLSNASIARGE
jgi:hypothetical protein